MLTQLPQYAFARASGRTPPLPQTYTFIVIGVCNSKCLTCGIRDQRIAPDLTLEEWQKTFKSLGHIFWATLSGGEPFMKKDLTEIHNALVETTRPSIVNIPTNSLTNRTPDYVKEMALRHPETKLVINISIDHCEASKNDVIRGVPGHWNRAMRNFEALKGLGLKNVTVGIHSVVSQFNVHDFPQIAEYFLGIAPDQYICEVAEERVELHTIGREITPSAEDYGTAIRALQARMRLTPYHGMGRVSKAFRLNYYDNTIRYLETHEQPIPCYAGYISAQINYNGEIWPCAVEAVPLGNLRENDYDFGKIWRDSVAVRARHRIRTGACSCPLANANYGNSLLNPSSLLKVTRNLFG